MLITFASWSTVACTLSRSESTVSPSSPFLWAARSASRLVSRIATVLRPRWVDGASDDDSESGDSTSAIIEVARYVLGRSSEITSTAAVSETTMSAISHLLRLKASR